MPGPPAGERGGGGGAEQYARYKQYDYKAVGIGARRHRPALRRAIPGPLAPAGAAARVARG
jgi:hypothetical protein